MSPWRRKPLSTLNLEHHPSSPEHHLQRHLSVWDLLGIGVGGTVGSGIFVLTGQIAATYAGRATWCSFALSGLAATCSGVCFAELSGRIPAAGSTYAYAYVCWGQLAAIVAAACLTLEYVVAGAAVARTWGDKVVLIFSEDNADESSSSWLEPQGFNLPAFAISSICTLMLLMGVRESKNATNFITVVKMLLVLFMVVAGFWLGRGNTTPSTLVHWAPRGGGSFKRGHQQFLWLFGIRRSLLFGGRSQKSGQRHASGRIGNTGYRNSHLHCRLHRLDGHGRRSF
jgi:amino acid transporter